MSKQTKTDWEKIAEYSKEDLLQCVKMQKVIADTLIEENVHQAETIRKLKQANNIPIVLACVVFAVYLIVT